MIICFDIILSHIQTEWVQINKKIKNKKRGGRMEQQGALKHLHVLKKKNKKEGENVFLDGIIRKVNIESDKRRAVTDATSKLCSHLRL